MPFEAMLGITYQQYCRTLWVPHHLLLFHLLKDIFIASDLGTTNCGLFALGNMAVGRDPCSTS